MEMTKSGNETMVVQNCYSRQVIVGCSMSSQMMVFGNNLQKPRVE